MAENKLPFAEGALIKRPHVFNGVKYQFWKVRTKIFIESADREIWYAILNCPFVPITIVDGIVVGKTLG